MVISWSSYLTNSFLLLVVYYAAIVLLYYRKDIMLKLSSVKSPEKKPPVDRALFASSSQEQGADKLDAASAAPMHSLVDELQAYVSQSGKQNIDKDELTEGIKELLRKYPAIKGSIFQEGITNLIAVIAENNCSVHFKADELSDLWRT